MDVSSVVIYIGIVCGPVGGVGFLSAPALELSLLRCYKSDLTSLLNPLVGNSPTHKKNSEDFIHNLNTISLKESDILVSFDMVTIFTRVPLEDTLLLLQQHFHDQIIGLFKQVLTTTYFIYYGCFYDQNDGVAIGSSLAPVIAKFIWNTLSSRPYTGRPGNPPACTGTWTTLSWFGQTEKKSSASF
jgi:hypothetical protein